MKTKRNEKAKKREGASFLHQMQTMAKRFRLSVSKEKAISDLVFENEERLLYAVKMSVRDIKNEKDYSFSSEEIPLLYRFSYHYLKEEKEHFSEKSLRASLYRLKKSGLEDGELGLFSSFLTLAAASLYVETGEKVYLSVLLHLSEVDFSALFFEFSQAEKIFLSEKAGIYKYADNDTKYLYHARLHSLAQEKRTDPLRLAKTIIEKANAKGKHIGTFLPKKQESGFLYFFFLFLMTAVLLCLYVMGNGAGLWNFLLFFLAAFPLLSFAKIWLTPFFADSGEKILPKLARGPEMEQTKVLISIATFLYGEEKDRVIFDKLEDFYLTEGGENRFFAVLGDLPQSKRQTGEKDAETFAYAKARISALRDKYGDHFYLFIRKRRFSKSENAYIGWERKRGGVLELCRFLRGKETSIQAFFADSSVFSEIRYLITLDADTNLYIGAVSDLLGAALHPENRPYFDEEKGRVTKGHAIIQPRMMPSLLLVSESLFARLSGGAAGMDPYAAAASDLYEELFDEGIYCGKGILDIDIFLRATDGFFPRERILSHDLAEGNLLRSALASDIVLTDGAPRNALSYYMRKHRWLRGDLQILPYLCRFVKNEKRETIRNPMTGLSKYKIFDNVLQASVPLFSVLLLALGFLIGGDVGRLTAFFVFLPFLWRAWETVFCGVCRRDRSAFSDALSSLFFGVASLAYDAYLFSDAAVRTLYRVLFSKRNFLNWTTAFEGDRFSAHSPDSYYRRFLSSVLIGAVFFFLPTAFPKILGIVWVFFPLLMWMFSREKRKISLLSDAEKQTLLSYTKDAWGYFSDYVTENTHGLPPDNVQFSPTDAVAMRTSPTNIGMYLLSLLAARDFDFISGQEFLSRATMTAETLKALRKWQGHLYNWYDLRNLSVLGDAFVSTVDSGNFVASLIAFCEGAKEYANEFPELLSVVKTLSEIVLETDFSHLYDKNRKLFRIGYSVSSGKYSDSFYDTFMSEARTTSFLSVAFLQVPHTHYFVPSRRVIGNFGSFGVASWSGTAFEYFMPMIFLPNIKGSLSDRALSYAYALQKRARLQGRFFGKKRTFFGISECGYFGFDAEMNYQYRAFGVEGLALDPVAQNAGIIAPYASFLMLEEAPSEVLSNLKSLESLGMYGKYGFYEALDLDPSRVGHGFAVLHSVMAHHLGMSILSAANLLKNGIFRTRFLRNTHMRAAKELLAEKMPTTVFSLPKKRKRPAFTLPASVELEIPKETRSYHPLSPEIALISNNKTKFFLSSGGHMELINGKEAIFLSEFDPFALGSGLRVYVNIDGIVFPTVPLGKAAEGFSSEFSFFPRADVSEYRSKHQKGQQIFEIRLRISVFPDREFAEISCAVSGHYQRYFAFLYLEPILSEKKAHLAHPSFSDLFLESRFHADEGVLTFARRQRNDQKENYRFGITISPFSEAHFETMREKNLPLLPQEKDYAALAEQTHFFQNSVGAMILPSCALRSDAVGFGKKVSFFLGISKNEEDLLYLLSECREKGKRKQRKQKMGALLHLQYSAAGLSASADRLERYLLHRLYFGAERKSEAKGFGIDRNHFWKYGISADHPIVLATLSLVTEDALIRLSELLALFKYLCIRGIRYDFVIFYKENDDYNQSVLCKIKQRIAYAGCENFVSYTCGIYPLNENLLSKNEMVSFSLLAMASFSLSEPLFASISEEESAFYSEKWETLLKKSPIKEVSAVAMPQIRKIAEVKNGFFHKDGFLLKKADQKAPFSHILASSNFGTVLTANSLGFTFARNAGTQKLTPHTADGFYEDGGERLILRLYDSLDPQIFSDYDLCASASWVDFRFEKALYIGSVGDISYTVSVFLIGLHDMKKISVSLETARKDRKLAVFFAVSPCLGAKAAESRFYRFQKFKQGIRVRLLSDAEKSRFQMAVFSPDADVWYTELAAMKTDGAFFAGKEDAIVLGAHQTLSEKAEISFFQAAFFSEKQWEYLKKLCLLSHDSPKNVRFSSLLQFEIGSRAPLFDAIFNRWSLYQVLVSRIDARTGFYQTSGAYGFRDQLQDSLALIPIAPEMTKVLILRAAAHQYEEGDVQHWWHSSEKTGIRTRCSDDLLWLPYVTAEYVKQTGDADILGLKIPYLKSMPLAESERERYEKAEKSDLCEPLFSHLLRALKKGKCGAHGLPLIGTCDWNDGMSAVGIKGKGESVWLAFFRVLVLRRMETLCVLCRQESFVSDMKQEEMKLLEALRTHGFDGEWYRRGYYDDGSVLGGKERDDCKIDLLPQAFAAILASENGFEEEKAKMSMASVWKLLYDRKHSLVKLLDPPFDGDAQSPGYIKGYLPGIRENGGQYTHAAVWAALGFLLAGEAEKGAELLFAINPAERYRNEDLAERYRIEPYVFAGDVYTNPLHMGRGGWSFYTGSAAWYRKVVLETLCGYTEEKDGFFLRPRLSAKFDSFTICISKKETRYQITVSAAGAFSLMLDGEYQREKENHFFLFDGKTHIGFFKYPVS